EGQNPEANFKLMTTDSGAEALLAAIDLVPGRGVQVYARDLPTMGMEGKQLHERTTWRIELAVRGRVCELRVNDECVHLGAVEDSPSRRVIFGGSLANVTGAITRFEATPLDAPSEPTVPEAKATPDSKAPLRPPSKPEDPALAWYHRALVEGYLARGRRSPAWDQAAADGLVLFCPSLRDGEDLTSAA